MRKNESAEIAADLRTLGYANLEVFDASDAFCHELARVADPEAKRRIVGRLFVEVVHRALARVDLGTGVVLAQGTIYPDTIESGGTAKADTIKTHHNRVREIEELIARGQVVEPLRDLYKDEVRDVGRQLGLPERLLQRHPFPGPGLVIRILCSNTGTPEPGFDAQAGGVAALARELNLASTVLPVRSVGVQGDSRTYAHPALVWPLQGPPPSWEALRTFAARVVNTHRTVNRVVLSVRPVAATALHLAPAFADRANADRLRDVDALVRDRMRADREIWQLGVVSLPLFDAAGRQAFVIRPVLSTDAMTADVFPMPWERLAALEQEACRVPGVAAVWIDVTTKPPATIEWE
jgi:GMP synthase (glutamine-hydrolysing)